MCIRDRAIAVKNHSDPFATQIGKISSENNLSIFSLVKSIFHEVSLEMFGVFANVPSLLIAEENSNASRKENGENEVSVEVTISLILVDKRPLT